MRPPISKTMRRPWCSTRKSGGAAAGGFEVMDLEGGLVGQADRSPPPWGRSTGNDLIETRRRDATGTACRGTRQPRSIHEAGAVTRVGGSLPAVKNKEDGRLVRQAHESCKGRSRCFIRTRRPCSLNNGTRRPCSLFGTGRPCSLKSRAPRRGVTSGWPGGIAGGAGRGRRSGGIRGGGWRTPRR